MGRDSSYRPSERDVRPRSNGASSEPTWNASFEPGPARLAEVFPTYKVERLLAMYGLQALSGHVLEYAAGTQERTEAELAQILERGAIRDLVEELSQKAAVEWFDSRRPERPTQPPPPMQPPPQQQQSQSPWQPFTSDQRSSNSHSASPTKGLLHKPTVDAQSNAPLAKPPADTQSKASAEPPTLVSGFKRIPKLRPISQLSSDKRPLQALQSSERFGADSASEDVSASVSRQHSEDELESSTAQSSRRERILSSDEERRSTGDGDGDRKQRDQSSDRSGITYCILA